MSLKQIIQDLINDRPEQARAAVHEYLVQKTKVVFEAEREPGEAKLKTYKLKEPQKPSERELWCWANDQDVLTIEHVEYKDGHINVTPYFGDKYNDKDQEKLLRSWRSFDYDTKCFDGACARVHDADDFDSAGKLIKESKESLARIPADEWDEFKKALSDVRKAGLTNKVDFQRLDRGFAKALDRCLDNGFSKSEIIAGLESGERSDGTEPRPALIGATDILTAVLRKHQITEAEIPAMQLVLKLAKAGGIEVDRSLMIKAKKIGNTIFVAGCSEYEDDEDQFILSAFHISDDGKSGDFDGAPIESFKTKPEVLKALEMEKGIVKEGATKSYFVHLDSNDKPCGPKAKHLGTSEYGYTTLSAAIKAAKSDWSIQERYTDGSDDWAGHMVWARGSLIK